MMGFVFKMMNFVFKNDEFNTNAQVYYIKKRDPRVKVMAKEEAKLVSLD